MMLIPQPKTLSRELAVPSVLKEKNKDALTDASGSSRSIFGLMANMIDRESHQDGTMANGKIETKTSLSLTKMSPTKKQSTYQPPSSLQKKIKGGLTLFYDAEADGKGIVVCMEQRRAMLSKYRKAMECAWSRRRKEVMKDSGNWKTVTD